MIKLYGVARSRASRNIWLMKEAGIAFDLVPVMQTYRLKNPDAPDAPLQTRSKEFLAINPNGHVPSLDEDGFVIHESLAINLYLARKAGAPLGPKDIREDSLMTMWALWAVAECEAHTIEILYNRIGKPPEERDEAKAQACIAALRAPFAVLDGELAKNGHPVGGRFTVADINLAEVLRYAQPAAELFDDAPHVKAWIAACQARPAFKAMVAMREAEPA